MTINLIYLHGFASSPQSKKARFFASRLAQHGITLHVPDLNVPDFTHLTLTAILERVAQTTEACPAGEIGLIGSSLGGLTALHFADRYRQTAAARVSKLLLLAPGFDFRANRDRQMGSDGFTRWQQTGWHGFYNYATDQPEKVHYGLVEDIDQYDSYAVKLDLPILIYHGVNDATVPVEQSQRFAQGRPTVDLRVVESDHELLDQTETIWSGMVQFFGLLLQEG